MSLPPATAPVQRPPRRRILQAAAAASLGTTAGCSAVRGTDAPAAQEYEQLHRTAVYVGDGVDLTIPDELQTVRATNNADRKVVV